MDAALIDGDHNWYTVYNELRLLADVAGRPRAPAGDGHAACFGPTAPATSITRRQIPDEFRQPYAQKGMRPREAPDRAGRAQPTMYNAELEGGPRNGVMTALDDFRRGYDKPLRVVVLPIYLSVWRSS